MSLPDHYYGTVPSLAWILGHFFYNATHFLYFAPEFYPYRSENPRTSNPYKVYQDIYEPWKENDQFSKILDGYRLNLIGGIEAKKAERVIDAELSDRLKRVCNTVNILFFYPVVCRIKLDAALQDRASIEGSGKVGSSEILISDLDESEIDEILFLDFHSDEDFKRITAEEYYSYRENGRYSIKPPQVLEILERRCDSRGVRLPISIPK